jgi:hypothetical protein
VEVDVLYLAGQRLPAGAAWFIALDSTNPPGRLVLGSDALRLIRAPRAETSHEIDRWEKLSASTDFAHGRVMA